jgi:DnaJ-domain-containing protein 1
MKRCPFCGARIQAEAIKCRYCRRFLVDDVGGGAGRREGYRAGKGTRDPGAHAGGAPAGGAATGSAPSGASGAHIPPTRGGARPRPGQLAVLCPHCGTRFVEVAKRTWFLHGLLLVARYGTVTHVGCLQCVNSLVGQNLVKCLLAGWWCFPWGLFTPVVLLQNLFALATKPPGVLFDVLKELRIGPEDVVVDERGLTPGLRRFLDVAAAAIAAVVWSGGGSGIEELRAGARTLQAISDGLIGLEEAEDRIRAARGRAPDVSRLDAEGRALLFRIAADAASADGALSAAELGVLHDLGGKLGIPPGVVREILGTFYGHVEGARSKEANPEVLRACEILGVHPGAPVSEIRRRYRSLMMLHHPDRAAATGADQQAAHRTAQEINWAYRVLVNAGAEAS